MLEALFKLFIIGVAISIARMMARRLISSSSSSVMEVLFTVEIVLAVEAFTYAWRCCSREDEDLSS